jgi:tetratricopeptide (TPR) repeat protein
LLLQAVDATLGVIPDDVHIGSVEVGGYALRVGAAAGTLVETGAGGATDDAEALKRALEEPESERKDRSEAAAAKVEDAAEATANIEKAASLCKGVSEGAVLSPGQLGLELSALLGCLERLDRKKEHKKALQLARTLATLLMLLKRWSALLQTLRIALRIGQETGDLAAVAWAKHELGALRLAAGDVEGADRSLREALEIRERIGDRRGAAATSRNLQVLCNRLREMLRSKELVRGGARGGRFSRLRVLAFAMTLALLFGAGGFAAGMIADDSGAPGGEEVAEEVEGPTGGPADTTGRGNNQGNDGGESTANGSGDDEGGGGPREERLTEEERTAEERANEQRTEEEHAAEKVETEEEQIEEAERTKEESTPPPPPPPPEVQ